MDQRIAKTTMKYNMKTFIVALGVLFFAGSAQNALAQTKTKKDSTSVKKGFNALKYSLQGRYLPKGYEFQNKKITDEMFVSAYMGAENMLHRGDQEQPLAIPVGVQVGKYFSPWNGARLTFEYIPKIGDYQLPGMGASVEHLFNTTNYLYGYNPGRVYNIETVVGLDVRSTKHTDSANKYGEVMPDYDGQPEAKSNLALGGHVGLQIRYHAYPHADYFFMPYAAFWSDNIDHSTGNWHRYDITYGLKAGMIYQFTAHKPDIPSKSENVGDNLFFDIGYQGMAQWGPNSNGVTNVDKVGDAYGSGFSFGIGKWFTPGGIRLSAWYGASARRYNYTTEDKNFLGTATGYDNLDWQKQNTRYYGLRLEGMYNINSFLWPSKKDNRFEVNVMGGVEIGQTWRSLDLGYVGYTGSYDEWINNNETAVIPGIEKDPEFNIFGSKNRELKGFTGFTGAIQAKYYVTPNIGFFIEPRLERLSYTEKGFSHDTKANLWSARIGMEIRRRNDVWEDLKPRRNQFHPYFFVGEDVGMSWNVQRFNGSDFWDTSDYTIGLDFGRVFTPYSTARIGFNYEGLRTNQLKEGIRADKSPALTGAFSVYADYMFHMTNFLMGFNPARRGDLQAFAGPVWQHNGLTGSAFGAEAGLYASYKASGKIDMYFQPRLRVFGAGYNMNGERSMLQTNPYQLGATLGMTYNFNPWADDLYDDGFMEQFFMQLSAGPSFLVRDRELDYAKNNGTIPADNGTVGPEVTFSVGKWFNFLGIRLSAFGQMNSEYCPATTLPQKIAYAGGRLEYMININRCLNKEENGEDLFEFIWTGGLELGTVFQTGLNAKEGTLPDMGKTQTTSSTSGFRGLTTGFQVMLNANKDWAVFVEPRFSSVRFERSFPDAKTGLLYQKRVMTNTFAVNLGAQIMCRDAQTRRMNKGDYYEPFWFIGFDLGTNWPSQHAYGPKLTDVFGNQFGINIGRKIDALQGVRLGFDYDNYKVRNNNRVCFTYSLDYMFSLTRFFMGTGVERLCNVDVIAGPVLLKSNDNVYANHFGGELGLRINHLLGRYTELYAEPKLRGYSEPTEALPGVLSAQGLTLIPTMNLGVAFRF